MANHNYFIYIVTNPRKTTLYIGVTNDIERRINKHYENRGDAKTFAGKYYCYNLIYFERYESIEHAIGREKELKKWSRKKKNDLINKENPNWNVLNKNVWSF